MLEQGNDSGRQLAAAVMVIALIVVIGLFLSGALRGSAAIQDCVAAGRTNCAPIATPPR